jgi:hypothetical protein
MAYPSNRLLRRGLLALLTAAAAAWPGGVQAAPLSARVSDARLKQRVTIRAPDVPLHSWLDQLSRQTGVTVGTAADYEDRLITVRAAEMPLGELMDAVAGLFGDVWITRGRKEAPSYVLEASLARRNRLRQFLQTYGRVLQTNLIAQARTVVEKGPLPWQVEAVQH